MTEAVDLPFGWAIVVCLLLLTGATLTLLGSIGLLRFDSFFQRLHAPTLGTTLGTGSVLLASMAYFSVLGSRPILHEVLLAAFLTLTTPVTFILLVRAARYRESLADMRASEKAKS